MLKLLFSVITQITLISFTNNHAVSFPTRKNGLSKLSGFELRSLLFIYGNFGFSDLRVVFRIWNPASPIPTRPEVIMGITYFVQITKDNIFVMGGWKSSPKLKNNRNEKQTTSKSCISPTWRELIRKNKNRNFSSVLGPKSCTFRNKMQHSNQSFTKLSCKFYRIFPL